MFLCVLRGHGDMTDAFGNAVFRGSGELPS